jgi:hypothetical protein
VADAIAQDRGGHVRGVFAKGDFAFGGVSADFLFCGGKQRANNCQRGIDWRGRAFRHPGQAFRASTAEKPQKEQFDLIIGVMGESKFPNTKLSREPSIEFMPALARGHFDGELSVAGQSLHISSFDVAGQFELFGRPAHQSFVCVAALPPKLVIQMSDFDVLMLRQDVQQHHRIGSA